MSSVKYIAAEFLKDSENLLKDFVQENSTNFTVFKTKWKEHNFSLIFSDRDKDELEQFTNEIFQLTLKYLENGSIILQIGATYLLYALFRSQRCNPPVMIRIILPQWEILRKLRSLSEKNRYMNLHYIINFMQTNSLIFVASSVMLGPCCSKYKLEVENTPLHASFLLKDCKTEMMNFLNSNLLEEIQLLGDEYAQIEQKFFPGNDTALEDTEIGEYVDGLRSLMNDETSRTRNIKKEKTDDVDLGNRRAKIKANQFSKKAFFRQLNPSDSDEDYEPVEEQKEKLVKKRLKKKRVSKEKRTVGRPKKLDLDKLLETVESDPAPTVKVSRRRGPVQRGSYLEKYELKNPEFNKKLFKDFLQDSETSEEEPVACKEEDDNTQNITVEDVYSIVKNEETSEPEFEDDKEASDKIQELIF